MFSGRCDGAALMSPGDASALAKWCGIPPTMATDWPADVNLGAGPGVDVAMIPERCRELLKSTGLARAKMYLKAHLDWLDGCPYAQSPGLIH